MSNDPTKTEIPTAEHVKTIEKENEQKDIGEKNLRTHYDVQAVDTKVVPSQK